MTTASLTAGMRAPRGRTLKAVRLQYINTQTFIWVPTIVAGGMLVLTVVVYWIISAAGAEGPMYSGGSQAPLWYFAVVGAQSMNLTFYFSQAMSLTRREFYIGSLLAAAVSALGIAVGYVLIGLIEAATGGYGINGYFVNLPWIWEYGPWAAGLFFFILVMLFFVLGFWFAILSKRVGLARVVIGLIVIGLAVLGGAAVISLNQAWGEVWSWLLGIDSLALTLSLFPVTAVFAFGSYLSLRRLTV